ncbi:MAG TPA: hypothetical protein DHV36_03355, partial [Desulfobacteraceae bacterium]|nr:hypothetical protein [Desulfobacteraceae bacterium]
KAITATIMGMIQSLNQVLNHSFSIQGIKWRLEALRTGRQFAEVVMLNTLVYQVEQIFLVHGDTGIVLEHVVAEGAMIQDPDLVSGMLTAIQDFVRDSFSTDGESESDGDLDTLRIGSNRSVWVEKGEHAFLAAVIRGNPPMELRTFYREIIEDLHLKAGSALAAFDGNTQPFALFRETLNSGLRFKEREDSQQISPVVWLIVALMVAAAVALPAYWGYRVNQASQEWKGRLEKIRDQKGVLVVSVERDDGVYRLNGLKDPLVEDPLTVLASENRSDIRARWQPFYSLDPAFVFQRAQTLLNPPPGVTLSLDRNTLIAKGKADQAWIDTFDIRATAIPGIDAANGDTLVNTDRIALSTAVNTLTALKIYFENNSTELIPGQTQKLSRLIETIRDVNRLMVILNLSVQITIVGHTDSSGTEKYNMKLSRERAETIYAFVKSRSMSYGFINTLGVGTQVRLKEETREEDRQFNRAVSFRANVLSANQGTPLNRRALQDPHPKPDGS